MRWYLEAHALPGLEAVDSDGDGWYRRALSLAGAPAVLSLRIDDDVVTVRVSDPTPPRMSEAVAVVRRLLDLDTDGAAVDARLAADPALAVSVRDSPGLRVPGAVDGWELLLRTMVGQQISLAAARTHLARLVAAVGEPWTDPEGQVWRLFPTASAVAARGLELLGGPRRRVAAVVSTAEAVASGALDLGAGRDAAALGADLMALPGVGPWTADYVVMRLAREPDVLLASDLVVRQGARLLGLTDADLARRDRWSPYRSYATMHLWRVALAARPAPRGSGQSARSR